MSVRDAMFLATMSKTAHRLEMAPDLCQKAMYAEFAMNLVTTSETALKQAKIKTVLRNLDPQIITFAGFVLSLVIGSKTVH
jgi:hypothetical protein